MVERERNYTYGYGAYICINVIGICLSHGTEWLHYSPGTPSFPAVQALKFCPLYKHKVSPLGCLFIYQSYRFDFRSLIFQVN